MGLGFNRDFWERGGWKERGEERQGGWAYLSGMGLWFWRFEEGVGQLPHPHGHGLGYDGSFRVHHGAEQRLQVGLGVPADMDDLVSGRRVVLARIHCAKTLGELSLLCVKVRNWRVSGGAHKNKVLGRFPKNFFPVRFFFSFSAQEEMWIPLDGSQQKWSEVILQVAQPRTVVLSRGVLAVEVCSHTQRFPGVSCWHSCVEFNKAHIYNSTLESDVLSSRPQLFSPKKRPTHTQKKPRRRSHTKDEKTQQTRKESHCVVSPSRKGVRGFSSTKEKQSGFRRTNLSGSLSRKKKKFRSSRV